MYRKKKKKSKKSKRICDICYIADELQNFFFGKQREDYLSTQTQFENDSMEWFQNG